MEKILLVDGYSLMFRAYYATAYGRMMTTSSNIPTNAIFAFSNMFMKVLDQIKPDKVLVALDSGKKTFRNELFAEYKGTRKETPNELVIQFPIIREFLTAFGIPWVEIPGYEADDIIGSLSRKFSQARVDILSSDRDLLQLINEQVNVLFTINGVSELKRVDMALLKEEYQLAPKQIIDLKGLMGDPGDNIPGIPKVGEKTATKWLLKYETLENVLEHGDEIGGKMGEAIKEHRELALLSKQLATICLDVPININFEECAYQINSFELKKFYEKYEMRSLINRLDFEVIDEKKEIKLHEILELRSIEYERIDKELGLFYITDLEIILLADDSRVFQLSIEELKKNDALASWFAKQSFVLYHIKETLHQLKDNARLLSKTCYDLHIASFLLDSNEPIDLHSILHVNTNEQLNLLDKTIASKEHAEVIQIYARAVHHFTAIHATYYKKLEDYQMLSLYQEVELPLSYILYEMELQGIRVDLGILEQIALKTRTKCEELAEQIHSYAMREFNINSPKQLAEVLFDEMGLPLNKKRSTAVDILEKLADKHPIISLLLEYRTYQKLLSTYAEGLQKYVEKDGRIHTRYQQCLAQTGRLSSKDPNLQNISIRNEESREIRKAFTASSENHVLVAVDYSQVELRMLAHMSNSKELLQVFQEGGDIHTSTGMKIFHVESHQVTSLMRRQAKAINFGIVYGISDFGLAEQIGSTRKEAQLFIERYFDAFPTIQPYMQSLVESCEKLGYVETLLGRRRYIKEIQEKNYTVREAGKRAAMNAPIQGSAADLIKLAMIHISNSLIKKNFKATMILQVHDELIFDVPKEEVESLMRLVKEGMEHAMELSVPLKVEMNQGSNWFETK